MTAFNPLQNFNQGFASGEKQKISGLQDAIAGQIQQGSFNPLTSVEFQQLSVLEPERSAATLNAFNALDKNRKTAFFDDAQKGLQLLDSGNIDGFSELLDSRDKSIAAFGGDNSDTVFIKNLAAKGDFKEVRSRLANAVNIGRANGFLFDPIDRQLKEAKLSRLQGNGVDGKEQKKVQNSRDVEGGTLITFNDGSQEFAPFGADQLKTQAEFRQTELPRLSSSLQNKQLELQEKANDSFALADKTSLLSSRFSKIDVATGVAGSVREAFLTSIGGEDEISNLRKDFTRVRNKLITANLPQGPATDKDIELIAAGFPPPTASKAQIVDFLNAMSRGQEAIAKFNEFQSVFLQQTGNITKANRSFLFDGQEIKKGDRLRSAYKRISKKLQTNVGKTNNNRSFPVQPIQDIDLSTLSLEELQALRSQGGQ